MCRDLLHNVRQSCLAWSLKSHSHHVSKTDLRRVLDAKQNSDMTKQMMVLHIANNYFSSLSALRNTIPVSFLQKGASETRQ